MARDERFTFLCDDNEKKAIARLAAKLSRSQSDAVRFVVIEAAKQLTQTAAEDPKPGETVPKGEAHAVTA
jgi:hypothetical protein